ncbi:MAG: hypothetical protein A2287_06615 [Candidatus Melainabacteria bacterium RIFOXYA12_FULL_32_12]|nr:MAG: hypothetical protein A2255_09680 [Candidatus Melainabacteria bacterium RIFOXYA2_FULL_32_9]OGI26883.1 MAG: hypothetical protein A2287_06615 [Candidatus Melainabacteria bacterium RIFOXYA12_FULL_32_12]
MNTLGTREEKSETGDNNYSSIPAVVRNEPKEISLEKALVISAVAHPAIIGLLWLLFKLLILLLAILGITLPLFDRPQPKIRDIEFVLVNKPDQKPLDPNTKFRADRNSRAGGKHDPNKPISEPEPSAPKSTPQSASAPSAPPQKAIQPRKSSKSSQQQMDTPVPPRPVPQQSAPKPNLARPNIFSIPVPAAKAPKAISPSSGGPVTSGPIGSSSPSSSPAPVMSSGGTGSSSQGRYNSGRSQGSGNAGNPSPGNPYGSPGIDAIKEPDFGPYMRELQRRIKRNWNPPRGNESKRVVILFKVSKDGRLLSLSVLNSSGNRETDQAAVSAVQLTAPFKPLPPEYRENSVDIQFTFDYNVFGISGGRH